MPLVQILVSHPSPHISRHILRIEFPVVQSFSGSLSERYIRAPFAQKPPWHTSRGRQCWNGHLCSVVICEYGISSIIRRLSTEFQDRSIPSSSSHSTNAFQVPGRAHAKCWGPQCWSWLSARPATWYRWGCSSTPPRRTPSSHTLLEASMRRSTSTLAGPSLGRCPGCVAPRCLQSPLTPPTAAVSLQGAISAPVSPYSQLIALDSIVARMRARSVVCSFVLCLL